jgi:hypothetical protein
MSWYVGQDGHQVWIARDKAVYTVVVPTRNMPLENLSYLVSSTKKAVFQEHVVLEDEKASKSSKREKGRMAGRQRGFLVRVEHEEAPTSRLAPWFKTVGNDLLEQGIISKIDVDDSVNSRKKKKDDKLALLGVNERRIETTARINHFAHGPGFRVEIAEGSMLQRIHFFTRKQEMPIAEWHASLLAVVEAREEHVMLARRTQGEAGATGDSGITVEAEERTQIRKDKAQQEEEDWLLAAMQNCMVADDFNSTDESSDGAAGAASHEAAEVLQPLPKSSAAPKAVPKATPKATPAPSVSRKAATAAAAGAPEWRAAAVAAQASPPRPSTSGGVSARAPAAAVSRSSTASAKAAAAAKAAPSSAPADGAPSRRVVQPAQGKAAKFYTAKPVGPQASMSWHPSLSSRSSAWPSDVQGQAQGAAILRELQAKSHEDTKSREPEWDNWEDAADDSGPARDATAAAKKSDQQFPDQRNGDWWRDSDEWNAWNTQAKWGESAQAWSSSGWSSSAPAWSSSTASRAVAPAAVARPQRQPAQECGECGRGRPLKLFLDQEDDQWYCRVCWVEFYKKEPPAK